MKYLQLTQKTKRIQDKDYHFGINILPNCACNCGKTKCCSRWKKKHLLTIILYPIVCSTVENKVLLAQVKKTISPITMISKSQFSPTQYQFSIWDLFMIVASQNISWYLGPPCWGIFLTVFYNKKPSWRHSVGKSFNILQLLPPSQSTIVPWKLLQWCVIVLTSYGEKLVSHYTISPPARSLMFTSWFKPHCHNR